MNATALRPSLGFFGLSLTSLGMILGAGIYSVLGKAAGVAGAGVWLSFVVAAGVAAITALAYAELATTFPGAGAEYVYLRRAFPRRRSLSAAVPLLVALSGIATTATVALAFAGYAARFVDVPAPVCAAGLIAATVAVNLIGVRESSVVTALCTLVEAGGLVLVVVLGALRGAGDPSTLLAPPSPAVLAGAALVFFSFLGFENVANLSEEAREPARDVPRAIFASIGASTALYVAVAIAVVLLLPPAELASSGEPLAAAAGAASPTSAAALGVVALFATANTALVTVLVTSRLLFGIARGGDLPRVATKLSSRQVPIITVCAVGAAALALLPLGDVAIVASVSSFASLLAFAAVNVALVVLRRRAPDLKRPFRVPLAICAVPVLPVLGALACASLATQLPRLAVGVGAAFLVVVVASHATLTRAPLGAPKNDVVR